MSKKNPSIRLSPKHGVNPMMGQCPLCAGDTSEIFLLGKSRDGKDTPAPRRGVLPGMSQPCDKCKQYMDLGFLLIECQDNTDEKNPYRTGRIYVMKLSAAVACGFDPAKGRAAFIEESAARKLGIPLPQEEK